MAALIKISIEEGYEFDEFITAWADEADAIKAAHLEKVIKALV